jgi:hypothetical protein
MCGAVFIGSQDGALFGIGYLIVSVLMELILHSFRDHINSDGIVIKNRQHDSCTVLAVAMLELH